MERPSPRPIRSPNPITTQNHRRESLYQIILPFLGATLLLIGIGFLLGKATSFNTAQGAEIALIGLILPTMVFGLIFLALTIGLIVGLAKLLRNLPIYTRSAQDFVRLVSQKTKQVADGSVEPIIRLQAWLAIWHRLRRGGFH
ncbi:MAG: hypothetical protein DDG59_07875 [Anaerolineae bacterium]|jgi:hypothetical protein|nr:MAG: hypothetical protein DDG59_07875 [Anaerolineae bacterium]